MSQGLSSEQVPKNPQTIYYHNFISNIDGMMTANDYSFFCSAAPFHPLIKQQLASHSANERWSSLYMYELTREGINNIYEKAANQHSTNNATRKGKNHRINKRMAEAKKRLFTYHKTLTNVDTLGRFPYL